MHAHLSKQQRHSSFQTRLASKLVALVFLVKAGLPRWIEFFESFYVLLVRGVNKVDESMDPSFATSAVD